MTKRGLRIMDSDVHVIAPQDEALIAAVVGAVGDGNPVVSSDWPHDDSSFPHAMEGFLALPGLSEETRRRILWDDCARLYGLAEDARA